MWNFNIYFILIIHVCYCQFDLPDLSMPDFGVPGLSIPEITVPAEDLTSALDECKDELGSEPDDIVTAVMEQQLPQSGSSMCLIACIKKKVGIIKDDNRYDIDIIRERLEPLEMVNEELYEKAITSYEQCSEIGAKISDTCLAYRQMRECIRAKNSLVNKLKNCLCDNVAGSVPDVANGIPDGSAVSGVASDVPGIDTVAEGIDATISGGMDAVSGGADAVSDDIPEISDDMPDMDMPDMDMPEMPDFDLPEFPELELPELELPELEMPELELPEFELPELEMPDFGLPGFGGDEDEPNDFPDEPDIPNIPEVGIPNIPDGSSTSEGVGSPSISGIPSIPDIGVPDTPNLSDIPKVPDVPSISNLPEVTPSNIPSIDSKVDQTVDQYNVTNIQTSQQIPGGYIPPQVIPNQTPLPNGNVNNGKVPAQQEPTYVTGSNTTTYTVTGTYPQGYVPPKGPNYYVPGTNTTTYNVGTNVPVEGKYNNTVFFINNTYQPGYYYVPVTQSGANGTTYTVLTPLQPGTNLNKTKIVYIPIYIPVQQIPGQNISSQNVPPNYVPQQTGNTMTQTGTYVPGINVTGSNGTIHTNRTTHRKPNNRPKPHTVQHKNGTVTHPRNSTNPKKQNQNQRNRGRQQTNGNGKQNSGNKQQQTGRNGGRKQQQNNGNKQQGNRNKQQNTGKSQSQTNAKTVAATTIKRNNSNNDYCAPIVSVTGKELSSALKACKTKLNTNITTDDVILIMQHQLPKTKNGKCLFACVEKESQILKENNRFNMINVRQKLEPLKSANKRAYGRAVHAYEQCQNIDIDETNECEAFKKLRTCVLYRSCKRNNNSKASAQQRQNKRKQTTKHIIL